MKPRLQRLEIKRLADGDDEFAVEQEIVGVDGRDGGRDFGEEAVERLAGFGEELDVATVLMGEAAKAIPFGLELPAIVFRQLADKLGLHRLQLRGNSKISERFWRCHRDKSSGYVTRWNALGLQGVLSA